MTYEDYLKGEFFKAHPEVLDDDIPESYETWLAKLDASDFIEMANDWCALMTEEARELGQSEGANRL